MKKAIIIILSVLIILGGVFAGLWFFTDILNFLKPSRDNFSIQLKKVIGAEKSMSYSEYETKLNRLKKDGNYTVDFNVDAQVKLPSYVMDETSQKNINSTKVNVKSIYDKDNKQRALDLNLSNSSNKLNINTVTKDDTISIKSDDLYNKYLTLDMSEYEKFCTSNNIEMSESDKESVEVLSKLLKNMNENDYANFLYDMYYISEEDYKDLQKNYGKFLSDIVDKENFKTEKNQEISVGDEDEVKATAYSLTLNGKDAYEMTKKLVEKMKGDDTLKKLIVEKYGIERDYLTSYAEIFETSSSTADVDLPKLTEDNLTDYFDEILESLEDSEEDFKESKKALKVTIFANRKNEPIKMQFEILKNKDSEKGTVIFTEDLEEGKNTYIVDIEKMNEVFGEEVVDYDDYPYNSNYSSRRKTTALGSIANNISQIRVVDKYKKDKESKNGTLVISLKSAGEKRFQEFLDINYEIVSTNSEESIKLSVTSPVQELSSASLDLEYKVTGLDKDEQEFKFNVKGAFSYYSIALNIEGKIYNSAEVPEVNSSNSVEIFNQSTDNLNALTKEIITNASNNLPGKLSSFGINVTKEDILKMLPQEEPATVPTDTTVQIPTDAVA